MVWVKHSMSSSSAEWPSYNTPRFSGWTRVGEKAPRLKFCLIRALPLIRLHCTASDIKVSVPLRRAKLRSFAEVARPLALFSTLGISGSPTWKRSDTGE